MKAPTKDPRTGKVEVATLESGPGAEAGAAPTEAELSGAPSGEEAGAVLAAMTALIEAAANMTAQEIFFFMSMVLERPALICCRKTLVFLFFFVFYFYFLAGEEKESSKGCLIGDFHAYF
ncbi:hypothetical protein CXB51_001351 [Gossypium anomalum]|uniref:Uncharacterized protein n=1 Tax=Gossypium anomalum TaxID=47600 RepID=A0A8J5ZAM5_9ROSI|nr:hypothetical protein CXB51_001351 [Gossypium anomalum]